MNRFAVFAFSAAAIIGVAAIGGISYLDHESIRLEFIAALQGRCAKQAQRVFAAEGWPLDGSAVNDSVANYTSHYNARLGRCLMLVAATTIDTRDKATRKHYTLGDAFEQAIYAEYFESALPGFFPLVLTCKLTVPNEKPVFCHSAAEWNRLVRPYIEAGR